MSTKAILDHEVSHDPTQPLYHLVRETRLLTVSLNENSEQNQKNHLQSLLWSRLDLAFSCLHSWSSARVHEESPDHYILVEESTFQKRSEWRHHLKSFLGTPFEIQELKHGVPLRIRLARVKGTWRLLLLIHHVICDEFSLQQLMDLLSREAPANSGYPRPREMAKKKTQCSRSPEKELALHYTDQLKIKETQTSLSLCDLSREVVTQAPLSVSPNDLSTKSDATAGLVHFCLGRTQVDRLRSLAHQSQCSLFELMLTCFLITWHRLDSFHAKKLLLGVPFTSITHPGCLGESHVNTARLVTRVGSSRPERRKVRDLLLRVSQHLRVVRDSHHSSTDLSILPPVEVLFVSHLFPRAGCWGESRAWCAAFCPFPLAVILANSDTSDLRVSFEYRVARYPDISGLLSSYRSVLLDVISRPSLSELDLGLLHLDLCLPSSTSSLLDRHSGRVEEHEELIPATFFRHALQSPDRPCLLEHGGNENPKEHTKSFTYGQVSRAVERLRNLLTSSSLTLLGQSKKLVPLLIPAHVELPVTLLALASEGYCAVMVDVDREDEKVIFDKLRSIRSDLCFLAITPTLRDRLSELDSFLLESPDDPLPIFLVDRETLFLSSSSRSFSPAELKCRPTDDLYGIFTSGSTGRPKLVLVNHQSAADIFTQQVPLFHLDATDLQVQFASLSFDASLSEMCTTWIAGAALLLCPGAPRDLDFSQKVLRHHGATVVTLPPSYVSLLPPVPLKTLVVAGEACTPAHLRHWCQDFFSSSSLVQHFVNAYGPTETTVCALGAEFSASDLIMRLNSPAVSSSLPLGLPLDGVKVRLCDRYDQPLSPHVPGARGELQIGGNGELGARYHYLADQRSHQQYREGWFRTGDIMTWHPKEGLQFHWRQGVELIKTSGGIRTSLAAVEQVILTNPEVATAVVIQTRATPTEKQDTTGPADLLVAFVVLRHHHHESHHNIRTEIRLRILERTRVTTEVVILESLPMSANGGKCDRKQLQRQASQIFLATPTVSSLLLTGSTGPRQNPDSFSLSQLMTWLSHDNPSLLRENSPEDPVTLLQMGLSSIQLIDLQGRIRSRWGRNIEYSHLARSPMRQLWDLVRHFGRVVDMSCSFSHLDPVIPDWQEEVNVLRKRFSFEATSTTTTTNQSFWEWIFLTGATGLLGSRILARLLDDLAPNYGVICLVRADSVNEAKLRLLKSQTLLNDRTHLQHSFERDRVRVILGDLSQSGSLDRKYVLPDPQDTLRGIIHSAAKMDFNADYEAHRVNLDSLVQLVQLASHFTTHPVDRPFVFHHVSTLGVFPFGSRQVTPLSIPAEAGMTGGYSHSKWVCETALRKHWEETPTWSAGVILQISRPGRLVDLFNNSEVDQVVDQKNDTAHDRLAAVIRDVGWIPTPWAQLPYDTTCVDQTAQSLSVWFRDQLLTHTIHVATPQMEIRHFIEPLPRSLGQVMGVPVRDDRTFDQWLREMEHIVRQKGTAHPGFPILPFLTGCFWRNALIQGWPEFLA